MFGCNHETCLCVLTGAGRRPTRKMMVVDKIDLTLHVGLSSMRLKKKINDSKTREPMIKAGIFDYSLETFLVHMTELHIHNTFFFSRRNSRSVNRWSTRQVVDDGPKVCWGLTTLKRHVGWGKLRLTTLRPLFLMRMPDAERGLEDGEGEAVLGTAPCTAEFCPHNRKTSRLIKCSWKGMLDTLARGL